MPTTASCCSGTGRGVYLRVGRYGPSWKPCRANSTGEAVSVFWQPPPPPRRRLSARQAIPVSLGLEDVPLPLVPNLIILATTSYTRPVQPAYHDHAAANSGFSVPYAQAHPDSLLVLVSAKTFYFYLRPDTCTGRPSCSHEAGAQQTTTAIPPPRQQVNLCSPLAVVG